MCSKPNALINVCADKFSCKASFKADSLFLRSVAVRPPRPDNSCGPTNAIGNASSAKQASRQSSVKISTVDSSASSSGIIAHGTPFRNVRSMSFRSDPKRPRISLCCVRAKNPIESFWMWTNNRSRSVAVNVPVIFAYSLSRQIPAAATITTEHISTVAISASACSSRSPIARSIRYLKLSEISALNAMSNRDAATTAASFPRCGRRYP